MRKIVLILVSVLVLSGLPLTYFVPLGQAPDWRKWVSLLHIWGGVLFLAIFSLYAWEHISDNRHWLRRAALTTFTGVTQTASGVLLILTGIVLLLYGNAVWEALRGVHHWLTYLLAASVILHIVSRKY